VLFLLLASPSYAQTIPGWEVFGGYSFQRSNVRKYFKTTPIIYALRNEGANLNGFDLSVTENINQWFGGTLDISGHFAKPEISGIKTRERMYTIMYGPRFSFRSPSSSMTPFAHILLGGAHMDAKVTPTGPHVSDKSFAIAAGGGLDMKLRNQMAIRIVQADYLHANSLGANQNSFRLSAGVILYLGSK
jgi:opacity protein-like surface antigen